MLHASVDPDFFEGKEARVGEAGPVAGAFEYEASFAGEADEQGERVVRRTELDTSPSRIPPRMTLGIISPMIPIPFIGCFSWKLRPLLLPAAELLRQRLFLFLVSWGVGVLHGVVVVQEVSGEGRGRDEIEVRAEGATGGHGVSVGGAGPFEKGEVVRAGWKVIGGRASSGILFFGATGNDRNDKGNEANGANAKGGIFKWSERADGNALVRHFVKIGGRFLILVGDTGGSFPS